MMIRNQRCITYFNAMTCTAGVHVPLSSGVECFSDGKSRSKDKVRCNKSKFSA